MTATAWLDNSGRAYYYVLPELCSRARPLGHAHRAVHALRVHGTQRVTDHGKGPMRVALYHVIVPSNDRVIIVNKPASCPVLSAAHIGRVSSGGRSCNVRLREFFSPNCKCPAVPICATSLPNCATSVPQQCTFVSH